MIKLINATKIYKTDTVETLALDKVNLTIEEGEMVAVMGVSGSGKTTLLNIIGGMDVLTDGEYHYGDSVVSDMSVAKLDDFRKNNVSFVFQQFALMNDYTVYENVEVPLIIKGVKRSERKKIVEQSLELVGIKDMKGKYANQISGGQQQRCAIARALAQGNKLILADEPTGALDSNTSESIIDLLRSINNQGKTVIVITHDEDVAKKCDRIIRIKDGKIA